MSRKQRYPKKLKSKIKKSNNLKNNLKVKIHPMTMMFSCRQFKIGTKNKMIMKNKIKTKTKNLQNKNKKYPKSNKLKKS